MDEPLVASAKRKPNAVARILHISMAVFAVLFLLFAVTFSQALMFPCFLMAISYYFYGALLRREYEYTLTSDYLRVDALYDWGRKNLHEIPLSKIEVVAPPDDPRVLKYKKGGSEKVPKYDYTSYQSDVPYYTLIAGDHTEKVKLLLDLTPEMLQRLGRLCPSKIVQF